MTARLDVGLHAADRGRLDRHQGHQPCHRSTRRAPWCRRHPKRTPIPHQASSGARPVTAATVSRCGRRVSSRSRAAASGTRARAPAPDAAPDPPRRARRRQLLRRAARRGDRRAPPDGRLRPARLRPLRHARRSLAVDGRPVRRGARPGAARRSASSAATCSASPGAAGSRSSTCAASPEGIAGLVLASTSASMPQFTAEAQAADRGAARAGAHDADRARRARRVRQPGLPGGRHGVLPPAPLPARPVAGRDG